MGLSWKTIRVRISASTDASSCGEGLMGRIVARWLPGVLVLGVVGLTWPRAPLSGSSLAPRGRPAEEARDRWMGVATCASTACHHANGPKGSGGSEYSTWAGHDKHARAFEVLYDKRSEQMVRHLYGDKAPVASETKLCLKCHSMNNGETEGTGPRFHLSDGVGCECCHGPAERWLPKHYQDDFRRLSRPEKEEWGLHDTKDLVKRAELCSTCHIGAVDKDGMVDKDVNHDLIAAGHPRLNFEFGAFASMVPRHWRRDDDRQRYPDLEARTWLVGQLVSARTALQLLQARAAAAGSGGEQAKPWPEFSEYACFACHQDLRADSRRQKLRLPGRRVGQLPWANWYVALAGPVVNKLQPGDLQTPLEELRVRMRRPSPEGKTIAERAGCIAKQLDAMLVRADLGLRGKAMSPEQIRGLMETIADHGVRRANAADWDEAAQTYLALAALSAGLKESPDPRPAEQLATPLLAMRRSLRKAFPPGYDSPQRFDPRTAPKWETQLRNVLEQLGRK
jgi:hypothetical protein